MDEFTNRIEELNSKLTTKKSCPSQQNMALLAETCDAWPTSSLGNGSLIMESPLRDEVYIIFQILVSHLTFIAVLSWKENLDGFHCVIICPIFLNY